MRLTVLRAYRFRFGFPYVVSLATRVHSLARSSKRNIRRWQYSPY
jgi:2-oxo-4-hydroxy-4-carboxy--5-ureidoimidazoline (OHCU) decarboxylase